MAILAAFALTDEALKSLDEWMTIAFLTVEKPDSTAAAIWSDVLQELDRRGLVKLISGSYYDVVNANVLRTWRLDPALGAAETTLPRSEQ